MTTPQDLADQLEKTHKEWRELPPGTQETEEAADRFCVIALTNYSTILASLRRSAPASGEMREAVLAEREACASISESWTYDGTLKLRAGEMKAQEARTAKAVALSITLQIRSRASSGEARS